MWWRFAVAMVILVTIMACGVLLLAHVDRVCLDIGQGLAMSVEAVLATGRDETGGLHEAHALWERSLPLFCTYVIHDQVDMVSETFQRATGQLEIDAGEYLATLRELQFWIGVIRSYDRPNVRSIF